MRGGDAARDGAARVHRSCVPCSAVVAGRAMGVRDGHTGVLYVDGVLHGLMLSLAVVVWASTRLVVTSGVVANIFIPTCGRHTRTRCQARMPRCPAASR
mgnify:CR=1 FL=1